MTDKIKEVGPTTAQIRGEIRKYSDRPPINGLAYYLSAAQMFASRCETLLDRLEKAEQTIKEISELIAYYRDIDAENPDETIRMIAVADELQTILNRSKS